jgi:hypothetical protein
MAGAALAASLPPVGPYVNTNTDLTTGQVIYFYTLGGDPSPHGNDTINSYDIEYIGDNSYNLTLYFQQGEVIPPYPPDADPVPVDVTKMTVDGNEQLPAPSGTTGVTYAVFEEVTPVSVAGITGYAEVFEAIVYSNGHVTGQSLYLVLEN